MSSLLTSACSTAPKTSILLQPKRKSTGFCSNPVRTIVHFFFVNLAKKNVIQLNQFIGFYWHKNKKEKKVGEKCRLHFQLFCCCCYCLVTRTRSQITFSSCNFMLLNEKPKIHWHRLRSLWPVLIDVLITYTRNIIIIRNNREEAENLRQLSSHNRIDILWLSRLWPKPDYAQPKFVVELMTERNISRPYNLFARCFFSFWQWK